MSWIWDVDFEPLLDGLETLVATGERAAELALRFTYAGFPAERIEVNPRTSEVALDRGLALAGKTFDELPRQSSPPTRQMLALVLLIAARGHVAQYWERAA